MFYFIQTYIFVIEISCAIFLTLPYIHKHYLFLYKCHVKDFSKIGMNSTGMYIYFTGFDNLNKLKFIFFTATQEQTKLLCSK